MELNEQFLNNPDLSNVEWELEKYYNRYRKDKLTKEYCETFEKQFAPLGVEIVYLPHNLI